MPDILDNTVTVSVGEDKFVFKVPAPLDTARIGAVAGSIRRSLDPQGIGNEECLDWQTLRLVRAMATMVVLLEKGPQWAFSEVTDARGNKTVAVDHSKFPSSVTDILPDLYDQVQEEVKRFHHPRDSTNATGQETVASIANTTL